MWLCGVAGGPKKWVVWGSAVARPASCKPRNSLLIITTMNRKRVEEVRERSSGRTEGLQVGAGGRRVDAARVRRPVDATISVSETATTADEGWTQP